MPCGFFIIFNSQPRCHQQHIFSIDDSKQKQFLYINDLRRFSAVGFDLRGAVFYRNCENKENARKKQSAPGVRLSLSLGALYRGAKELVAQQQSKSEIRRPAAFIFFLLHAYGGGCILSSSKFVLYLYTRIISPIQLHDRNRKPRSGQVRVVRPPGGESASERSSADVLALRSAASTPTQRARPWHKKQNVTQ